MYDAYSRMENLLGQGGVKRLSTAKIAVFGLGGVGACVVEALARCGVGSLTLVDYEDLSSANLSRQLLALHSTIGKKKVQAAKERIRDIDEDILVHTYETFYNADTAGMFDLRAFDYIVDAMDTIPSKVLLIGQAAAACTPVISCMDTADKINPFGFAIADIGKVRADSTAREIRSQLRKRRIRRVKVLYARERRRRTFKRIAGRQAGSRESGSISFVTGVAGFLIAGEVVRDLLRKS